MHVLLTAMLIGVALGPSAQPKPLTTDGQLPGCSYSQLGTAVDCFGTVLGGGSATTPSDEPSGSSSGPQTKYVPYTKVSSGPDGQPCVDTGYYADGSPVPGDAAPSEVPSSDRVPGSDPFSIYYQTYPPCPAPEGQAPSGGQDTPAQYAARYWERVPLPRPSPYVAPGWAITGKLAYLETRGQTSREYHSETPFGPLVVVATGRYYVDWGDGEMTGPYSFEGRPWPEGEIRHDYVWARSYDVVVTERWTATWSLGGQSGTLRELATSGAIDDLPARQIQAVIRR